MLTKYLKKIETKYLFIYVGVIAVFSLLSCYIATEFTRWLHIGSYKLESNFFTHTKDSLSFFYWNPRLLLNIFGWDLKISAFLFTHLLTICFLVAIYLFYNEKAIVATKILKFGLVFVAFNALWHGVWNVLVLCSSGVMEELDLLYDAETISLCVLKFVISVISLLFAIELFKRINAEALLQKKSIREFELVGTIFDDAKQNIEVYEKASLAKRFTNWFIDNLVILNVSPQLYFLITETFFRAGTNKNLAYALLVLSTIIISFVYYGFTEKQFTASAAKIITNTIVVQENGTYITWHQSIHRNAIRSIPIEFLSAFSGEPWHDTWSGTYVLDTETQKELAEMDAQHL